MLPLVEIALELRTIPMFGRLSTQQLIDLGRLVREEEHPEQTTVVREGEYGTCMYLIVSGEVEVQKEGRHLAMLGARDFFGDMAVLDGETRSANVVTRTKVELLRLEQSDLLLLMEENGAIAIAILQSLSQRLRHSNERPAP